MTKFQSFQKLIQTHQLIIIEFETLICLYFTAMLLPFTLVPQSEEIKIYLRWKGYLELESYLPLVSLMTY